MAKRYIVTICLLFVVLLSGCSQEKRPDNISESHYKYGLKALEIIDSYLDFDSTSKETKKLMAVLVSEKDNLPETEFEHPNHAKNFSVESKITILDYDLLKADLEEGMYDVILSNRNKLAKLLNKKER